MVGVSMLPTLPEIKIVIGVSASILTALVVLSRTKFRVYCYPFVPSVVGICVGTVAAVFLCQLILVQQLEEHLQGVNLQLTGSVSGLPKNDVAKAFGATQRWQFDLIVSTAEYDNADEYSNSPALSQLAGSKLRLTWMPDPEVKVDPGWFIPGTNLQLTARLKKPRGMVNPVGFDYQRWLLSAGYTATGFVKTVQLSETGSVPITVGIVEGLDRQRLHLKQWINRTLPNDAMAGPIIALTIGDKSQLSAQQWRQLQDSGTLHLLVVSGLHVSLVATVGFMLGHFLARLVSLRRETYCVILPCLLSLLFATGYAALAGFTLPTQRALIMTVVANLFWAWGWQKQPWLGYWLAMCLVLMVDPLAGFSAGFWLSFTVVAFILWLFPRVDHRPKAWQTVRIQMGIFFGMLLPLAATTGQVGLLSPLVNFLAIPYISLVIVPAALLSSLLVFVPGLEYLAAIGLEVTAKLLHLFWLCLDWLFPLDGNTTVAASSWHRSIARLAVPAWYWLLLSTLVGFLLMPIFSRYLKGVISCLVIAGLIHAPQKTIDKRLTVLDVGQGLATLLQVGNQVMIYDTGPQFSDDFQAAESIIAPYIDALGFHSINALVISHGDADHASGVDVLNALYPSDVLYSGEPGRLSLKTQQCRAGTGWQWQDVHFEFLWPGDDFEAQSSANDHSCVLLVSWQDQRILFTGDISKPVEWNLAALYEQPVTVLIAPHHGSKTSSSHRFIGAFRPRHVVFSTGYNNRYHHPNSAVTARYKAMTRARQWNTADNGAIIFDWPESGGLDVQVLRYTRKRFWY